MQDEKFEIWALVELMGRQRIAGKVTEQTIAGAGFLRCDVPETKKNPAFTRFIAPGSVYAINPITEEVARQYAETLQVKPIDSWDISAFVEKATQNRLAVSLPGEDDDEDNGSTDY
jgi:hypothetical protein